MSETSCATVKKWLAHPLPRDVAAAIDRLARTDDAQYVAVMPDVHLSQEVCIGCVLATTHLIYPNAVGGDIGCGIAAVAFDAPADVLANEPRAAQMLQALSRAVPGNRHAHANRQVMNDLPPSLSHPRLKALSARDGAVQFGTLGRGNHFLEFQADEQDQLWLMVHSGSRAIGQAIRDMHIGRAARSNSGLFYLDACSPEGQAFLADMEWARAYAAASRRAMITAAAEVAGKVLGTKPIDASYFACDHNHVAREVHFGRELWVHRKGAMSAREGEAGILPGSMGSESYHIEGRGCAQSLCSSAHGAGRAMSREEARRKLTVRDVGRQLRGVWFDHRLTHELREEAPAAYKDVRAVARAQRGLARIIRRLRPLLCYKAAS
jgi:tRNA-splicing ligase RtcB (3'-phosphate/5'-hydroxy nucleic acid ligase)